ncbi:PREDICTED: uncharacterized protein LOC108564126 [Nicrophorus vespilloides]|uniref:Uncharacterized protein LOC108564126 n=1 Tax=Nicrophorus vespilloides TaxID=110193 RepID=A0ABM1MVF2_NICVS|nr:PREDICTED: uncharacterized protein LOC108564126 [Nicrophorus vespilloides]
MIKQMIFLGLIAFAVSYPHIDANAEDAEAYGAQVFRNEEQIFRPRRFVGHVNRPRPGQTWSPPNPKPQGPQTSINPSINTNKAGTTNVGVDVKHERPGAKIQAHIDQNVKGPGKSGKPNWNVHAQID